MTSRASVLRWCLALSLLAGSAALAATTDVVPSPEQFFGFRPGADNELVDYGQLVAYLNELDRRSDRLTMVEVGRTPLGRPMYCAFISSATNVASLDSLREVNRRLALDPRLEAAEVDRLVAAGRVFVMVTPSMHADEVAPAQAVALLAHELVTTEDPRTLARLDSVVLMILPSQNPDGMDMVVAHHRKYRGTAYQGCDLPGVYHRYIGHDNNRDFVTLTQEDTRVVDALASREWFPQVLVEKHQMGSSGPRYFVPAPHDPIAENVDEPLWSWSALFGAAMATDMATAGLKGVASHWLFDDYWPGSTETVHWKNVISFLTEAASCRIATPVYVEATELHARGKGLAEYKKSVNMPDPWPGGWWRLGDIVTYELATLRSILATAAAHREEILRLRNDLCRAQVEKGRSQPPYFYVLPLEQHDRGALVDLVNLLLRHGVEVDRLTAPASLGGRGYAAGNLVVPLAQPYRAFVKEVMEHQRYPVRHYSPGGQVIRPYDVTSWCLPLHFGVRAEEIAAPAPDLGGRLEPIQGSFSWPNRPSALPATFAAVAYPATDNAGFAAAFLALELGLPVQRLEEPSGPLPAGSFVLPAGGASRDALWQVVQSTTVPPVVLSEPVTARTRTLHRPRIALVETWFHDINAGWTRFLLDSYHLPYQVLRPGEIAATDLAERFDLVLFPDQETEILTKGRWKDEGRTEPADYPPEFTRPIGDAGLKRLRAFLDRGGIVLSWGRSTGLFLNTLARAEGDKEQPLDLPARDLAEELDKAGLYVPGTFLRVRLATDHPLAWGMPAESGILSEGAAVFATDLPILDTDRRVIAAHPDGELLLSGYLEGEEQLRNRPVMVWLRTGKGQLVLYGFDPLFRASTPATYKLLFNAILLPRIG